MDHPNALEFNAPLPTEARPLPDPPAFHSLGEAINSAKANARLLAGEAAPKLKQAIRTVAYDVVYGATFGACFAAAFAREVAPTALKSGVARGTQAGLEAARRAKASFTVPASPAPSAPEECTVPA